MPLRIQCANCGKLLILGAGAGLIIVCPACGTAQRTPAYEFVEDVRPALPDPTRQISPARASRAQSIIQALGALKRPTFWITASVVMTVGIGAILLAALFRSHPAPPQTAPAPVVQDWETTHRQDLIALILEAERLAVSNHLKESHDKYVQVQEMVVGQTIKDPQLAAQIAQAQANQELVYKILLASQTQAAPLAVAPDQVAYPHPSDKLPSTRETQPAQPMPVQAVPTSAPVPSAPETSPTPSNLPPIPGFPARPASESAPVIPANPETRPAARSREPLTDTQVSSAIKRGVDYLLSIMPDGELDDGLSPSSAEHASQDALVVYALLQASRATSDVRIDPRAPVMAALLDHLKRFRLESDPGLPQAPVTFGRSMRAAALAVYNRPDDKLVLTSDVAWLVRAENDGAYTNDDRLNMLRQSAAASAMAPARFGPPMSPVVQHSAADQAIINAIPNIWDNSNSSNGTFGVLAGAHAGIVVPAQYWQDVFHHWTTCQRDDGQWASTADDTSGSLQMTCGGLASVLAAFDSINAPPTGAGAYPPSIAAALNWLDQKDNAMDVYNPRTVYLGYNVFNLERVGLATGYKHFGKHDWYAELSSQLISMQFANGAWGRQDHGAGAIIDTAYITTFLSLGRASVMMTKLRFAPAWNDHPRDLANLTQYAQAELGRPLTFEAVGFDHPWQQWADAPILYIAGHRPPQLKAEDEANIKAYIDAGGVLFTHADGNDPTLDRWARDLAHRLYPGYPFIDLPFTHPIYSLFKPTPGNTPRLQGVSNGARLLIIHSPGDIAGAWEHQTPQRAGALNLGVALFLYAAGEDHWLGRLKPLASAAPLQPDLVSVPIARIKYNGSWDPEAGAWSQLSRALSASTNVGVQTTDVSATLLDANKYPIAHLTGTTRCAFTDAEIAAIGSYVASGGTLLIDACGGATASGGSAEFADVIEQTLIPQAFEHTSMTPLLGDDPIMQPTLRGMSDLSQPRLRTYAADKPNTAGFRIYSMNVGKGRVLYSTLDLTSGMLGTRTYGIVGYDPDYAQAVVKNIVIYVGAQRGY